MHSYTSFLKYMGILECRVLAPNLDSIWLLFINLRAVPFMKKGKAPGLGRI